MDQWSDKWKVTGSYFLNQSDNLTQQQTQREYFEPVTPGMTYSEYKENSMKNWNHRLNLKLDYQISDRTSLQIRPSLNFKAMTATVCCKVPTAPETVWREKPRLRPGRKPALIT